MTAQLLPPPLAFACCQAPPAVALVPIRAIVVMVVPFTTLVVAPNLWLVPSVSVHLRGWSLR